MRVTIILLSSFLLSGCSLSKQADAAKMKVAQFHALMNAGNFDQIVANADPRMKWPARGPSFKDYLASVHRKLGFCGSWRMLSYVEEWKPTGRVLRLNADTHCDNDNAQESFVFDTGDLKLRGYSVTSRVLVVS
jgi:hypothetical protein